ncbi:PIN domain-containing protein [Haladaptatus sp. F3-133]|uniref:PIN domain-containing protein n=1 Tax=Halorutilus salinus TaxID=2487751 RepID=A0A9Q4C4J2_9EURY|nr:PIN domain-containing protein [Halorutilus salinus]MCX2819148.1 PIN domain-containing protein [Halorutilus salinus]
MKLLDTTFLVDHQRGDEDVAEFLERQDSNEKLVTSSINLKEIAVGKMMVEDPIPSFDDVLADFGWLTVEPFDGTQALEAARIEAKLRGSGDYEPNLSADILIAGVARGIGAPVVTRNVSDFERIGVDVEGY